MDYKQLELKDLGRIKAALQADPISLSDYSFGNLWMWNPLRSYHLSESKGLIIIKYIENGRTGFLFPIGRGPKIDLVIELMEEAKGAKIPFYMRAIPDQLHFPYPLILEPGHCDYIYNYEDLLYLPGNHYQAKRNLIHQFTAAYSFEYRAIEPDLIPQIEELETKWFVQHGVEKEHQGALHLIRSFFQLPLLGGVLLVDNQVIAYTIAEYLNSEMLVIHIEKALTEYKGVYQMINQEFLKHQRQVTFVNREEDLTLPNLQKIKKSYHPVRLENKFTLSLPA